ncbi:hypothetical protein B0H19DRAFT_1203139 [Mycena capillaripes]|nr:hypothetical protein B0H19DRAFT_1203139 [Mycena capillaripes]
MAISLACELALKGIRVYSSLSSRQCDATSLFLGMTQDILDERRGLEAELSAQNPMADSGARMNCEVVRRIHVLQRKRVSIPGHSSSGTVLIQDLFNIKVDGGQCAW